MWVVSTHNLIKKKDKSAPLSHLESCCSVRIEGRFPRLLKMVKSLPIKSVATPAYSSSPRRQNKSTTVWIIRQISPISRPIKWMFLFSHLILVCMGSITDEHRCSVVSRIIRTLSFPVLHFRGVNPEHVVLMDTGGKGFYSVIIFA